MALTTYSELKSAIADWLNRDDLSGAAGDFITLAEARFNREIRHWRMEKRDTLTISSQYTALPSDFVAPIRLSIASQHTPLRLVSVHEMQRMRDVNDDAAADPYYWSVTGGGIEVFPTPGSSYTGNLVYYETIPALSDSNTTNWLLTYFPDAYLYGALTQSAPYLVEDARTQTWAAFYSAAIKSINDDSNRAKYGGALRKRLRVS